jgi:putative intracellular protease/amidase
MEMNSMKNRILVIVTNEDKYKTNGDNTGLWLGELTHFYEVISKAGISIDIVSAKGGSIPLDPLSTSAALLDDVTKSYYENEEFMGLLKETKKSSDVKSEDYDAIYFTGGHGTMWDFPDTEDFQKLSSEIYEDGGIVSAVCHGVGALLNIKSKADKLLIKDKAITGYSNDEEVLANALEKIPFKLEDELKSRGAKYTKSLQPFTSYVVEDGRIITGQNPQSTKEVAEKVLQALRK